MVLQHALSCYHWQLLVTPGFFLHCRCFLNSILQVLRYTPGFSNRISALRVSKIRVVYPCIAWVLWHRFRNVLYNTSCAINYCFQDASTEFFEAKPEVSKCSVCASVNNNHCNQPFLNHLAYYGRKSCILWSALRVGASLRRHALSRGAKVIRYDVATGWLAGETAWRKSYVRRAFSGT